MTVTRKQWAVAAAVFLCGIATGWWIAVLVFDHSRAASAVEIHEGQSVFVNPLLECENGDLISGKELVPFKSSVEKLAEEEKSRRKARSIAVYFRDLNNGPWFGIDEREEFVPASLLKVPLLMAYLKHAEDAPSILKKKIHAYGDTDSMENIRPRKIVEPGKQYTVEELLFLMIVYSENNAMRLLTEDDGWNYLPRVYTDLGIPAPQPAQKEYPVTVKTYASFFRILFNASYLSRERSNQALDLLSMVDFHGGLRAGVPPEVAVAHKFGERKLDGEMQFHDCGIVYYPERPYLLCVMSRGEELADLVGTVQDISHRVFTEVDRQMREGNRR